MVSAPKTYHVPSVESACRMLRAVCESGEAMAMADLASVAETSRTTAMRIASSLVNQGFLLRDEAGKFRIGAMMHFLGSRVHFDSDLRQRSVPVLTRLVEQVEETAHLLIPMESHCLLQEVIDNPRPVRVAARPGTLVDYHCSAGGKVLLAFREDLVESFRQSSALSSRTPNTLTHWNSLSQELEEIRRRGYSIDEEEYHEGVRCAAAPVQDHTGRVVAAIGVTGATSSLTKRRLPQITKLLTEGAQELSLTVKQPF